MFCPSCGRDTPNNTPNCQKCGFNFSQNTHPQSPQGYAPPPKNKGVSKAVIVSVVIAAVVIIGLIFVGIVMAMAVPSIVKARRLSREGFAHSKTTSFALAASHYYLSTKLDDEAGHYWRNYESDFGNHFSIGKNDTGYRFKYFSNSDIDTETTKYIFVAYPRRYRYGSVAYLVDETGVIYICNLSPNETRHFHDHFSSDGSGIDWEGMWVDESGYSRLDNAGSWIKGVE